MRYLILFTVASVFLCYTSASSALSYYTFSDKDSALPQCHMGLGSASDSSETQGNISLTDIILLNTQDGNFDSCCQLSLINNKDLDTDFQYSLSFFDIDNFFEKTVISNIKTKNVFFSAAYSPPDLVIQKSSLLI